MPNPAIIRPKGRRLRNRINPFDVLDHTGSDQGLTASGDYGLNLAYDLGALASGSSLTLT